MSTIVNISLSLVFLIFSNYFFSAFVTKPLLGDSTDYHIPIANSILNGQFLSIQDPTNPFMYYPGSSNAILSLFILFHIPLNLFGLLGWILLFFLCKKLGIYFGLSKQLSLLFATSICTSLSVVRQIPTQSVDMWIAVFFVWSIVLLEMPKRNISYFLMLGFSLGMLFGTKYSGPLFTGVLVIVYLKKTIEYLSFQRVIVFLSSFSLFGLVWYIKNAILKGNPLYPANFFIFKGQENFPSQDWMLWKIPIYFPDNIPVLINGLISEYTVWSFSIIIALLYLGFSLIRKTTLTLPLKKILTIGILVGIASLLLPIAPLYKTEDFHIFSDMRYLFNLFIPFILAVFLIAQDKKLVFLVGFITLLNTIIVMHYPQYRPKIYLFSTAIIILKYYKFEKITYLFLIRHLPFLRIPANKYHLFLKKLIAH